MEKLNENTMQSHEWNVQFSKAETERAMQAIEAEVAREKQRDNRNCEVYHALQNPFEPNTPPHDYIEKLLFDGSERDAAYIDLFACMQDDLKVALEKAHTHSFFMLNCRFNAQSEDNFLLYVIVNWDD